VTVDRTLTVSGLAHHFDGRAALDGVSFTVRPGRLTGFVGANGAGKTTTMRVIMGVLKPDEGTVLFGGQRMNLDIRRRVGYMPEERGLYPKMKVLDQLVYLGRLLGVAKGTAKERAERLLEEVGLADRAGDLLHVLSLGNQQRVQVAAALIHNPEVLVLDEPFSGLDPSAMDAMGERLRERAQAGVPVLFSSHQLELVERLCDDLVVIHHGKIVAAGESSQLREERAGHRYRIEIRGYPTWVPDMQGVRVVSPGHEGGPGRGPTVVELDDSVDAASVLAAAQQAGAVTEFGRLRPTLSQVFAEVTQ